MRAHKTTTPTTAPAAIPVLFEPLDGFGLDLGLLVESPWLCPGAVTTTVVGSCVIIDFAVVLAPSGAEVASDLGPAVIVALPLSVLEVESPTCPTVLSTPVKNIVHAFGPPPELC